MFRNFLAYQVNVNPRCFSTQRPRRHSVSFVGGIALIASLFTASGALAANCVPSAGSPVPNLPAIGSSPAAISSMVGSTITTASTAFLLQSTAFVGSPPDPAPNQQGGGIWVRGVGGEVSVKSSTSTTVSASPQTATGSVSCFQKVDQNFGGVQFGADTSRLNYNGWNFHVGTTAGVLEAKSTLSGGAFAYADPANGGAPAGGGSFGSTTQVPFIGEYVAATNGGFAFDALLRAEYYQTSLNAPGDNLFSQNIDAHGISFSSSMAYQWQVPNSKFFIEPSAGVVISRVKVDPLNFLTAGTTGAIDDRLNMTLRLNEIKSDVGRAGLRFGTTIESGNIIWQPFAAVSIWHEFGPSVSGTSVTCPGCAAIGGAPTTLTATGSTTNFGTYGQYSLGLSAALAGTGWLGFARVDYRDGSELQGLSGTGGIRYQFTPDPEPRHIMAMKTKAPPPALETVNWSGYYLGAFGGATQGTADWNFAGGGVTPHIGGYLFGGDVGYNYQTGAYVLGIDADLAGTNTKGGEACNSLSAGPPVSPLFQMTCKASADWIATLSGRLGYSWERALFYVKGGGAWTDEHFSATCNTSAVAPPPATPCTNPAGAASSGLSANTGHGGWLVGFGTDFALSRNWFARAEYDYISFGDTNVTASDGSALKVGMHVSEEKVGINYKF